MACPRAALGENDSPNRRKRRRARNVPRSESHRNVCSMMFRHTSKATTTLSNPRFCSFRSHRRDSDNILISIRSRQYLDCHQVWEPREYPTRCPVTGTSATRVDVEPTLQYHNPKRAWGEARLGSYSKAKTFDGITFTEHGAAHANYISLNYHRFPLLPNKTLWSKDFSVDEEYTLFCTCRENNWQCASGIYWGVVDKAKRVIGESGEKISQSPNNTAPDSPWHSYPIDTARRRVPDEIVDHWQDMELISGPTAKRIRRGDL